MCQLTQQNERWMEAVTRVQVGDDGEEWWRVFMYFLVQKVVYFT